MNFHSRWRARCKRLVACTAATMCLLVAACAFLRIHRPADIYAYVGMAQECHPVWRQFAFRRFGFGDSASDLLQRYPPSARDEFGRYGVYQYFQGGAGSLAFTGLSVVSRDGKLITANAGSCTWQFRFFRIKDPELDRQYAAYAKEQAKNAERKRLERLEANLQAFAARHSRWPTNAQEFADFAIGPAKRGMTNNLGITLIGHADGTVDLGSLELPGEPRHIRANLPAKETP